MSGIGYNRCPNDDWKAGTAPVGVNPETGKPLELNINGISAVVSLQATLMAVSAAMKAGHEEDFLQKIALCLFEKLQGDPHAICPTLTVMSMCLTLLREEGHLVFGKEGQLIICPLDAALPLDPKEWGPTCMYQDNEESNDVSDEEPVDSEGTGEGREPRERDHGGGFEGNKGSSGGSGNTVGDDGEDGNESNGDGIHPG